MLFRKIASIQKNDLLSSGMVVKIEIADLDQLKEREKSLKDLIITDENVELLNLALTNAAGAPPLQSEENDLFSSSEEDKSSKKEEITENNKKRKMQEPTMPEPLTVLAFVAHQDKASLIKNFLQDTNVLSILPVNVHMIVTTKDINKLRERPEVIFCQEITKDRRDGSTLTTVEANLALMRIIRNRQDPNLIHGEIASPVFPTKEETEGMKLARKEFDAIRRMELRSDTNNSHPFAHV